MTCPVCGGAAEPAAHVATVAICALCGASLVLADDGQARRATGQDTTSLNPDDLQTLRQAMVRTR